MMDIYNFWFIYSIFQLLQTSFSSIFQIQFGIRMCKKDQRFQQVALKHVFMTLKLVEIGGANCFLVDKRIEKHLSKLTIVRSNLFKPL